MKTTVRAGVTRFLPDPVLVLMVSTIGFVALLPLRDGMPKLVDVLQVLLIGSAVWVCAEKRRHLIVALGLGLPGAVLSWISEPQAHDVAAGLSLLFGGLLWVYVVGLMLRRIVRTRAVSSETLYLAVSSYMLLGFLWTAAYTAVELYTGGGAFSMPASSENPVWVELYYFSFVTLSTLGYGDITPVASAGRSLAILEAISGQMFIGLLIARLVGKFGVDRS